MHVNSSLLVRRPAEHKQVDVATSAREMPRGDSAAGTSLGLGAAGGDPLLCQDSAAPAEHQDAPHRALAAGSAGWHEALSLQQRVPEQGSHSGLAALPPADTGRSLPRLCTTAGLHAVNSRFPGSARRKT